MSDDENELYPEGIPWPTDIERGYVRRMAILTGTSEKWVADRWSAYSEQLCAGWLVGLDGMSAEEFERITKDVVL